MKNIKAKQCLSSVRLLESGAAVGLMQREDGRLTLPEGAQRGFFVSRTYDSGEKDTEWNRLLLDLEYGAVFWAYVYLFNGEEEKEALDRMDAAGQSAYLKACAQCRTQYRDSLICGEETRRGRYAKLCVELFAAKEKRTVCFSGFSISFPREDFTAYLPAVYQNNEALSRYMAVLQSVYLDMEEKIEGIAQGLDYESCTREQEKRLASWIGWEDAAQTVDEHTLRRLLRRGVYLACRKGTKAYYEELAEILTRKESFLVEEKGKRVCRLYIKGIPEAGRADYLELLKRRAPLDVRMEILILKRTDRLDGKYFLDSTAALCEKEWELSGQGIDPEEFMLL